MTVLAANIMICQNISYYCLHWLFSVTVQPVGNIFLVLLISDFSHLSQIATNILQTFHLVGFCSIDHLLVCFLRFPLCLWHSVVIKTCPHYLSLIYVLSNSREMLRFLLHSSSPVVLCWRLG